MVQQEKNITTVGMPYEDEDTIDLLELFFVLLGQWKLILVVMLTGGILAGAYHYIFISPAYRANAEIYITNTDAVISFQDVQLSAELTVDYEEILRSRSVLKKVIRDQKLDMSYKELSEMITISNPKDSHCLKIFVQGPEPNQAIGIANSLVKFGIDQIYRVVGNNEPSVIDSAEADAVEVIRPRRLKYVVLGAAAGGILVCGLLVLGFLLDMTLKTEEDIEKYMGLTVLAAVPEFSDEENPDHERENGGKNTTKKSTAKRKQGIKHE